MDLERPSTSTASHIGQIGLSRLPRLGRHQFSRQGGHMLIKEAGRISSPLAILEAGSPTDVRREWLLTIRDAELSSVMLTDRLSAARLHVVIKLAVQRVKVHWFGQALITLERARGAEWMNCTSSMPDKRTVDARQKPS
ncbi:hypothetical protein EYF80_042562 [Liparis tanakae]|uniref:Uncharacterized protein n=1 Tax=Liparis tanakae TaxID=230148 RepID=A0A4Z2G314_9TELE|nr:hypothetical protein EYF80_042562 [Liparis tanakae]